ncbi:GIY-YIG nuclease family protein [Azoarcus olearius]|uniref:Bacteriophage T5 Orf172 DNA-binding domain-containing protein n=1 Tax=Azoarcus sp. (strain BH72) TaxID=418699 RepID=A1K8V3_AZOSB|nr:GIY-YIG nuclease family protein [Azoarcus olearius]CAL95258.1 hypothetical protein azo2641 [Azoarcus olearius]
MSTYTVDRAGAKGLAAAIFADLRDNEGLVGTSFRLREVAQPLLETKATPEQRNTLIPRPMARDEEPFEKTVWWYLRGFADGANDFDKVGRGIYRKKTLEDIDRDVADDAGDEEEDDSVGTSPGFIYAFTFPLIEKKGEAFPIKIGKTIGDAKARIEAQTKGSAIFEPAMFLKSWRVTHFGYAESAIHNILKFRGCWMANAPGKEWFMTTVEDVESIIRFLGNSHSQSE